MAELKVGQMFNLLAKGYTSNNETPVWISMVDCAINIEFISKLEKERLLVVLSPQERAQLVNFLLSDCL